MATHATLDFQDKMKIPASTACLRAVAKGFGRRRPDRQAKKYRITIQKRVSYGLSCSPIDVEDFQEFKDYIREKGIFQVSLGYFDMIDDYPQIHEAGIKVDDITMKHFEWLVTKSFGRSRHMEVVLNKH